ncbi:shikimate dehydrogenase [Pseudarthrobacter sp. C4D7]|uniref:shikimate dehydrogenase family protein n=1 Tax=Pseudarthrobacter sp. C4D7 TaxID=2735268 RepID=UPI001584739F|nr:shikimate dehydrogenase [Pseudarthrobacter sp. C4D7]NUT70531.1 shikimate dehydrogenase [Pseudarthrobacter sp. C4D7]
MAESRGCPARLVLIGSAASQAMSPALWNPVLAELGGGWTYEAWDVPAGADLAPVRDRLLEPDIVAANVTMPHKHWAAATADDATSPVRLSGACNLLVRRDGRLAGHNTDVTAVKVLLADGYQRHAVLLGAGGAARAALVAIKGTVGKVSIADRDVRAAEELLELARGFGTEAEAVPWQDAQELASTASLIINATPVGKKTTDGPVWGGGSLAPGAVLYDYVYARHVTASVERARELGARCIDGWDHLREQAVAMVPLLRLDERARDLLRQSLAALREKH